ncbi:MAG: AAA family ATPase, partial [Nanoarchaeota archaeon]
MPNKTRLQDKVQDLYDRISNDFYLNREDFEANGQRYNSALLFGTLTELNKGKMLLFGEYGGGKTTSAEYLNSVFNNLPLDLVKRVAIRGNPQETKESIIANPDYGLMNTGDREWGQKPMWTHWAMIGPKIIDEFPRIPESNQAIVLDIVDRGNIGYMRGFISQGRQPFFATANYADKGSFDIIPAMRDRFDVAVESGFPGVINALHIAQDYHNDKDDVLENLELTRKALDVLNSGKTYEDVQKELEVIVQQQQAKLRDSGFSVLTAEDKEKIEQEIRAVKLNIDAEHYFAFLVAEMNSSQKYGQK